MAISEGGCALLCFVCFLGDYTHGLLIYENKTTRQGDDLAAAYIGKWMSVTGRVHDIYGASGTLTAQIFDKDEKFISTTFSTEESEKVSNISRGETITVQGEIDSADGRLKLVNCDLVRTDPS